MRLTTLAFAAAAALSAMPAAAATYSATLASPAHGRFIGRDIVWNCGPAACQGASDYGRPVVLCQSLAKQAGHVDAFVANGRALASDELDKCNTLARKADDKALAAK